MSDRIASLGAAPDSTYGQGKSPKSPAEVVDKVDPALDPSEAVDPGDLRLIIEDDEVDGVLFYKIIDGRTGVVVQRLPREQVLSLRDEKNYVAGQVIKTRA